MNLEEYKGVYIFAEQVDNRISGIAFELVGKAKDLAADLPDSFVTAVLLGGPGIKEKAYQLAEYGADKVMSTAQTRSSSLRIRLLRPI